MTTDIPELPQGLTLLEGWEWCTYAANGTPSACLFTHEYDCTVYFESGSIHISTGVAPWEIVFAVMVANKLLKFGQEKLDVVQECLSFIRSAPQGS